jgi:senataxin
MSDGDAARAKREDEAAAKRKRESVLSYWGAVVKDDRKLCKFDLGSLERKMFSWSVQDIFNRDLFREQVTYHSGPLALFASVMYSVRPAFQQLGQESIFNKIHQPRVFRDSIVVRFSM